MKEPGFSKAVSKAATNSYASNYSSGSSSANVMSQGGGGGLASAETETELAWEAGFRAGQEAMAMAAAEAAEEEWQAMMSQRLVALAKQQSRLMLGDQDDPAWGGGVDYSWAIQHAGAAHRSGSTYSRSSYHAAAAAGPRGAGGTGSQGSQQQALLAQQLLLAAAASAGGSGQPSAAGGQLPEALLGDCAVDMEASLVDCGSEHDAGALAAAAGGGGGRLTPPTSPQRALGLSLPGSRLASPRAAPHALASPPARSLVPSPRLAALGSPRPLHLSPAALLDPGGAGPLPPGVASAAALALGSPRLPLAQLLPGGAQHPHPHHQQQHHLPQHALQPQPGDLDEQASVHMADAGDAPSAEFENMFESKYSAAPGLAGEGLGGVAVAGGGGGGGGAGAGPAAGSSKGLGTGAWQVASVWGQAWPLLSRTGRERGRLRRRGAASFPLRWLVCARAWGTASAVKRPCVGRRTLPLSHLPSWAALASWLWEPLELKAPHLSGPCSAPFARTAGATSPNSLLPTHISAFGDGVDLAQAAAAVSPVAACLPTHISEFGEDDGGEPARGEREGSERGRERAREGVLLS